MAKPSSPRPDGAIDHRAGHRVLRLARTAAGEPAAQPIDPDDPAAVAIHRSLSFGVERLHGSEAAARQREPEGVHRMRTSSRRLRSVLRTFASLLDPPWAEALEAELKWLGQRLGGVRDLDVLQERLIAEAGDARPALEPLFESLRIRSEASRRALDEALDGARFGELMGRLADAADRPRLRDEAWEPCRSALPALVREAWKRVKKRGRGLRDDDPDDDYHETRKRAKGARYAAEAVMNALGRRAGRDAERFAERARNVQDVLGAHQDSVVAAAEVALLSATNPDDRAFQEAAAALRLRLEEAAEHSRRRFFKAWRKFDRKKVRRWLEK